MNHSTPTPKHPLLACMDAIEKALAATGDSDPLYLDAAEKAEFLVRSTRLISQQEARRLRAVAAAGDVAADHGCRTVADWIAPRTGIDRRAAYAQEKLAQALDETWRQVAGALADGRVHLDQARVIVKALDALPDDVTVEVRQLAERRLVEHADEFGPTDLARLGRRVLDVIAPEVGDEQERKALERAERKAEAVTRLDFKRRGDGSTDIAATVPDAVAARLKTYLEAFTSPRRQSQPGQQRRPRPGHRRTTARRPATRPRVLRPAGTPRPDAAARPRRPGHHGGRHHAPGDPARPGSAPPGSAPASRSPPARPAAWPAPPASSPPSSAPKSEVLDLGRPPGSSPRRSARHLPLQTPAVPRRGLHRPRTLVRSPPRHPLEPRGKTDLDDGLLLCHWHHKRAHDPRYRTERLPNGDLRYHRRT